MAVRIIVDKGPDKGKALELDGRAEKRIGRGPGNHLMVQDPGWQGTLRVSFSQGVCKVTNQTPTTIYLGGKTFAPGEQRAWFHSESLQPTAQTLLVLYVEDTDRESAPVGSSKSLKAIQLLVILLCLPVAGVLFFLPSDTTTDEQRGPEESQKEYHRLETRLQALQETADGGEEAARVLTLLKKARFEQLRKHSAQAFTLYHRVREEVELDLGGPLDPRPLPEEVGKILREVRDFVNQELITLGPEARKK
jgi:hypothetical protein